MRQVLHAIGPERVLKIVDIEATTISHWAWWLEQQYDDLYQQGMLKVCESISRCIQEFQSRSAAEQYTYVRCAARSGCISYMRKQKRHYYNRADQDAESFQAREGWDPTPERSTLAIEQLEWLQDLFIEAMVSMSRREREAFLWRLGMGPEMSVSPWTARTYSDRAHAKLLALARRKKIEWLTDGQIAQLFLL